MSRKTILRGGGHPRNISSNIDSLFEGLLTPILESGEASSLSIYGKYGVTKTVELATKKWFLPLPSSFEHIIILLEHMCHVIE